MARRSMQPNPPQRTQLELILEELGIEIERLRHSVKIKLFGKPACCETNAGSRVRYSVVRATKKVAKKGKGPGK